MKRLAESRELSAIFLSVLFLVMGIVVLLLFKSMAISAGDAVFVSLLLIPILVFVIFTGRLSEFRAPGGLEAKFVTMANEPVEKMASEDLELLGEDFSTVAKGSVQELETLEARLDTTKRILLKLKLGGHYDLGAMRLYVERLMRYPTFQFTIFVDHKERLVAYMTSWSLARVLKGPQAHDLLGLVTAGNVPELWDFPGVLTRRVSIKDNIRDALQTTINMHLEAIPLVDEQDCVKGVVEREQILSKLLLGMAK